MSPLFGASVKRELTVDIKLIPRSESVTESLELNLCTVVSIYNDIYFFAGLPGLS